MRTQQRFLFCDPEHNRVIYSCRIQCQRCEAHSDKTGRRCKNRTCFLLPYCWIHAKKYYGIESKPSTIPDSGRGMFATRPFAPGDYICPLGGAFVSKQDLDERYDKYTAPYAIRINGQRFEDGACYRIVGNLSNTGVNPATGRINKRYNNARFVYRYSSRHRHPVWLQAFASIAAGDEILTYYGSSYRIDSDHTRRRTRKNLADHLCYTDDTAHTPYPCEERRRRRRSSSRSRRR
jgi:hypothetical protein